MKLATSIFQVCKEPWQDLLLLQKTLNTQVKAIYVEITMVKHAVHLTTLVHGKVRTSQPGGFCSTHSRHLMDKDSQQKVIAFLAHKIC